MSGPSFRPLLIINMVDTGPDHSWSSLLRCWSITGHVVILDGLDAFLDAILDVSSLGIALIRCGWYRDLF